MKSFRLLSFIVCVAAILYFSLLFVLLPSIEFNNDYWLPKNNPYQQKLDYLEKEFQPGFGSLIVIDFKESFFNEDNIKLLRSFIRSVESLDNVFKVNSPLDATVVINNEDMLTIQTYNEALMEGHIASISDYRRLFKQSPYNGKLLSNDETIVGISVSIDKKNDDYDFERRVVAVESIRDLIQELSGDHLYAFMTGDAAIYYDMDQATLKNLMILLPIALILLVVVIRLFLFQWRSVAIVLIPTLVNLGLVPIVIVLFGHYITIINVTLFILVLVIAVADGIHMLNYWQYYSNENFKRPILMTVRASWLPCFITSITTAIGFGSFISSSIIPLYQYGMQAFFVIIFSFIIMMTLVPLLLRIIPPKIISNELDLFPRFNQWLLGMIRLMPKRLAIIPIIFIVLMCQALWFLSTETSFISVFFKKDNIVRQQVDFVDTYLSGSGRLDVILSADQSDRFKELVNFNHLNRYIVEALSHPYVHGVNGLTVPVSLIHSSFDRTGSQLPQSDEELEQEILFLEFSRGESKTDVLSSVVDFNYQNSRIEFITHQLSTTKINELVLFLNQLFNDWQLGDATVTGSQFLSYVLGKYVLQSQFMTILITFIFVWLMFISLFGIRLGSLGMIPNILPMGFTLSLLPLTGTPFDFATVLISSVTLGLSVDDTIHWMHYYQMCLKNGDTECEIKASKMMFKPLLITSVVLGVGFGVLGLSDLVILQKFGMFTFIAIFMAWFADIVVLPAILKTVKYTHKPLP